MEHSGSNRSKARTDQDGHQGEPRELKQLPGPHEDGPRGRREHEQQAWCDPEVRAEPGRENERAQKHDAPPEQWRSASQNHVVSYIAWSHTRWR